MRTVDDGSGDPPAPGVSAEDVSVFLGLGSTVIDELVASNPNNPTAAAATDGSAIKQTISVVAGERITFGWNFLTNDVGPLAGFNDLAFVSITDADAAPGMVADTFVLADLFNPGTGSSSLLYAVETEYSDPSAAQASAGLVTRLTFGSPGTFILGFGVVNVNDDRVSSALLIDGVSSNISSNPTVPEPASLAIWSIAGLVGIGFVHGRRRRKGRSCTEVIATQLSTS